MDKIVENNKCTGCTACMSVCPKNAINMITSEDGFKYPVIDQDKCIDCGLCKKICPVLNTKDNKSLNDCFVGYSNNSDEMMKSSSGGLFPLIANEVLSNNGIVVGTSFDDNNVLKHVAITKSSDLLKLQGSKYLQSDLGNIFSFIKENINDKKILFVGTPCQVAGLKSFLKKEYDNLICVDLFCHGVPSPKLFNKYINELENDNGDKIITFNFRDKSSGWDTYSYTATYKNHSSSELASNNNYSKLFLSDVALRESCYNCNFKLGNKYSDITLGDFWGVKKYYPEMYNKSGVSAIIINTEKGKNVFDSIIDSLVFKDCKLEEILSGNLSLKNSAKKSNKRDEFFNDLDSNSVSNLVDKYVPKVSLSRKVLNKIKSVVKKLLHK